MAHFDIPSDILSGRYSGILFGFLSVASILTFFLANLSTSFLALSLVNLWKLFRG